ncbi:MAG: hypothetical protein IJZ93_00360 [Clostridia bacterium]|nr:hypothetical protein [Clostridia bacterium]
MCDICLSVYGHDENCDVNFSSLTKSTCYSCGASIEKNEKIAIFKEKVFCRDCVNDLSADELCYLCDADDLFDLSEKFELCKTDMIIDTSW